VSCSENAWSPDNRGWSLFFASRTAVSNSVVPAVRVRRKASSSAYATAEIRAKSVASSG
jgi:hypothetical protein